ncbi:unnamed protein product, partial [Heterotrigona itama]
MSATPIPENRNLRLLPLRLPACLPAPPCTRTSVCAPLLSRYRGNVFRPVRVHYRHAGRFTSTRAVRARPRLISRIYGTAACAFAESRQRRRRLLQDSIVVSCCSLRLRFRATAKINILCLARLISDINIEAYAIIMKGFTDSVITCKLQ